jgi:hypothetical protein
MNNCLKELEEIENDLASWEADGYKINLQALEYTKDLVASIHGLSDFSLNVTPEGVMMMRNRWGQGALSIVIYSDRSISWVFRSEGVTIKWGQHLYELKKLLTKLTDCENNPNKTNGE